MLYTELILRPKTMAEQTVYPREARRLLAKALDGFTVSPQLFGRDATGKTMGTRVNRRPPLVPVIFNGGKGFLRLYGVGDEGREVLRNDMGTIVTALSRHTEGQVILEIKEGKFIHKPGMPRSYRINRLALGKHGKVRGDKLFAAWEQSHNSTTQEGKMAALRSISPVIKETLDWYLDGAADQLGIDLPRDLDINVVDGELVLDRIHADRPGHVVCIKNLRFFLNGELYGPWAAGHLRGHGFGLIRREIQK